MLGRIRTKKRGDAHEKTDRDFCHVIQMMPGGETAIATSFIDNRTGSPEGEVSTVRAFETDVWQKIDGEWKIVSLHYSEIAPDG